MQMVELVDPFPVRKNEPERTKGIHLSSVYRDMAFAIGVLKPEHKHDPDDPEQFRLRMEMGFLWEDALSVHLAARLVVMHPGEFKRDGIIMTPDGFNLDDIDSDPNGAPTLEEYKVTWKSSRRYILDEWLWMTQMKGYMAGTGMGITRCIFRVLYLMGDYKGSGPQYRVFLITVTERERDETWDALVQHSRIMKRDGKRGEGYDD